jgi:hypothetical protein
MYVSPATKIKYWDEIVNEHYIIGVKTNPIEEPKVETIEEIKPINKPVVKRTLKF